jgi:hypothetical protein
LPWFAPLAGVDCSPIEDKSVLRPPRAVSRKLSELVGCLLRVELTRQPCQMIAKKLVDRRLAQMSVSTRLVQQILIGR